MYIYGPLPSRKPSRRFSRRTVEFGRCDGLRKDIRILYNLNITKTSREASFPPTSRSSFSFTIQLAYVALVKPISCSIARLSPNPLHTTPHPTASCISLSIPSSALTFSKMAPKHMGDQCDVSTAHIIPGEGRSRRTRSVVWCVED